MTELLEHSNGASSAPEAPGGASPSSPGSSRPLGTADDTERGEFDCPVCAKEIKNRAGLASHLSSRHPEYSSADELAPTLPLPGERRPSSDSKAKRGLFGRRAKTSTERPGPPATRPSAGKRVSTAPVTSSVVAFAAGGLARIGQTPLATFAGFTAPVAGEIVDDAIAGTVVDKMAQPLVRGSEKYQNLSALVAGYAAVAWASSSPEAAESAYGLFHWSMSVILPLAGKEMVARAKAERKAAEQMAELMPELRELGFGEDPIRGLWSMMWAAPAAPPAPAEQQPEGAPVP